MSERIKLTYHLACTTKVAEVLTPAQLEVLQHFVALKAPNEEALARELERSSATVRNHVSAIYSRVGSELPEDISLVNKDTFLRGAVRSGLVRVLAGGRRGPDKQLAGFTGKTYQLEYQQSRPPHFMEFRETIAQALIDSRFSGLDFLPVGLAFKPSTVRNELGIIGRDLHRELIGEPERYVDTRWLVIALLSTSKVSVTAK